MEIITIDQLDKKQEKEVIALISDSWNLSQRMPIQADHDKTLKLFITFLNMTNDFAFYAISDHKIVGLIIGKTKTQFNLLNFLYYSMKLIRQAFVLPFLGKEARQYFKDYFNLTKAYPILTKNTGKLTNEVSLFAVSSAHQGQGIGKKLMKKTIEHYQSSGVKQFELFTDTTCSYQFYDKNAFHLLGTQKVALRPNHEETVMLYQKSIYIN
ncbi:hypothetical protein ATZ33_01985 [Enterococcus silesiacus]|uniref:N-acetyltransferase domain-containing protein n=1 Tax=Enterococcus silesiacus TaxID=332949 RepID=A0A0S3K7B6_9ENTE|nr:GNAT family N-acetyltransferase [Enterococcus silesiacus]ALS00189.1 hypothetical protein ATZ33_01985 [Enterococcus silesiacus]OJG93163.1 hypothetical protein RV15_GL001195 [Enterococcus silesiacus]